ncbi:hypothetical protein DESUT3_20520 [Desulfuromonas versatilis]|uniref:Diguanylate cyclase/phosphodiesterase with GAF sensor n=1 Tax=Desulfuromonas versatilis TaxID=2802975 RepID=A0ABN6DXW6_9BACT|nr:EAL domain-containing protein [Desulfuromonas versatilis]BCR04983.1 hypothetical protein DESUT3_20520 [Desulfuromonas versatilis]
MKICIAAERILQSRRVMIWVVGSYLLLAALWLLSSRVLPNLFIRDLERLHHFQVLFDISLILSSAIGLGFLTRRFLLLLQRKERELTQLVEGVCSAEGESFFTTLTANLAKSVDADYAFVCEFTDDSHSRVRTIAVHVDGLPAENFEFDLVGTPCGEVIRHEAQCFPARVREQFPLDHIAKQLQVESYAGIPLRDSTGQVLGPLAVFSRRPMADRHLAQLLLQLFAVRAATELERRRATKARDFIALHDELTGLPNRRLFCDLLGQELSRARQRREMVVAMFLDLDRFKNINDTLGHAVGDRLLKAVARRLETCLRREDLVGRLGGDEFMIMLTGIRSPLDVKSVAGKILDCLKPSFCLEGHELHIASSIGIALFPEFGGDVETLLKNADTALHRAKELGRNNYQFYSPDMNAKTMRQLGMEAELRKAIERNDLCLHYQPQFEIETGQVVGIEALVRWNHPERGMIPPEDFISLAEETGLIVSIGNWVLSRACAQNRALQDAGLSPLRMAVNLSPRQFNQRDLPEQVAKILRVTGLEPCWLELEITESIIMQDLETTIDQMVRLMELGVRISIDDFGTGYSSLSYLKRFPIQTLKIDRSFVRDIGSDSDDTAIVAAVIALAHNLKLEVVAEGVETQDQLNFLKSRGCDLAQGFLFSRPISAEALLELLLSQAAGPALKNRTRLAN